MVKGLILKFEFEFDTEDQVLSFLGSCLTILCWQLLTVHTLSYDLCALERHLLVAILVLKTTD